jgi:hypothetical protein
MSDHNHEWEATEFHKEQRCKRCGATKRIGAYDIVRFLDGTQRSGQYGDNAMNSPHGPGAPVPGCRRGNK